MVDWFEDLTVPRTPQFAAPAAGWVGSSGFRRAMKKLDTLLAAEGAAT